MNTATSLIPADIEPAVQEAIASGRYESEEQVIAFALKLWKVREEQMDDLRSSLQEAADQLDRGEGVDGKLFIQEMRKKLDRLKEMDS